MIFTTFIDSDSVRVKIMTYWLSYLWGFKRFFTSVRRFVLAFSASSSRFFSSSKLSDFRQFWHGSSFFADSWRFLMASPAWIRNFASFEGSKDFSSIFENAVSILKFSPSKGCLFWNFNLYFQIFNFKYLISNFYFSLIDDECASDSQSPLGKFIKIKLWVILRKQ